MKDFSENEDEDAYRVWKKGMVQRTCACLGRETQELTLVSADTAVTESTKFRYVA